MTHPTEEARRIAGTLTRSEALALCAGKTWSAAQRNRLIAKGIVPEACRGTPCVPKLRWETPSWYLPLNDMGKQVLAILQQEPKA